MGMTQSLDDAGGTGRVARQSTADNVDRRIRAWSQPEKLYGDQNFTTGLVKKLDPRHFARAHRSAIVNVRRVKAIHPWFNGHHVVTMDNGQQLRMSRYQHEAFLKLVSSLF